MKREILVVGVTRFDGVVEGRTIHQAKVLYLEKFPRKDIDTKKGYNVVTAYIPYEEFTEWTAPAYYEIDFDMSSKGMEINDHKLIRKFDVYGENEEVQKTTK